MIRAVIFMVKLGLLAALAVWLASQPGSVTIDWLGYTFTLQMGVFLTICIFTILLAILLFRVIHGIAVFPRALRRYFDYTRREKGYRALTLGLTAVAAGDSKSAAYQAQRAVKFLPRDTGLPVLLQAQAARMEGQEDEAREKFSLLLENKDAAFLGVRGLLQAALDLQDYPKALELAREALRMHPKQPWILRVVYDLEIKMRDWPAARTTLYRAEKAGAVNAEKAGSDRIAMLVAEAEKDLEEQRRDEAFRKLKKAHGFDPSFAPVVQRLAKFYIQKGKRKKAVAVLEKAWKTVPHPELVPVWGLAAPQKKGGKKAPDPLARLKWYERLVTLNPASAESEIAVASAAMEGGLWGEAREHLKRAEDIAPSARVYNLLIELEERATQNEEAIENYLALAADAPPEKQWVCSETGRVYPGWEPVAQPHGSFNTIVWDYPEEGGVFLTAESRQADTLLEAPKT